MNGKRKVINYWNFVCFCLVWVEQSRALEGLIPEVLARNGKGVEISSAALKCIKLPYFTLP